MVSATRTGAPARRLIQLAASTVGAVFLLVDVLGFVPGITTDYPSLSFASGWHTLAVTVA